MNKIEKLINELCWDGVEFKELGKLWNKAPKSKIWAKKITNLWEWSIVCFTSWKKNYQVNEFLVNGRYIFVNDWGNADFKYHSWKAYYTDHVFTFWIKEDNIDVKYVYYFLKNNQKLINETMFQGTWLKNLKKCLFMKLQIPIPPLKVQKEIVNILDKFDKLVNDISQGLPAEIKARKQQYEYYREKLLNF